jgi:hypothetical protein
MGTNPHRDTSNYSGASLAKARKIKASSFKSVPPAPGYRTPQHDADPKRFPDAGYFGKQLQRDSWPNWRAVILAMAGRSHRVDAALRNLPSNTSAHHRVGAQGFGNFWIVPLRAQRAFIGPQEDTRFKLFLGRALTVPDQLPVLTNLAR